MSATLAAICGLLIAAAARELWAEHCAGLGRRLRRAGLTRLGAASGRAGSGAPRTAARLQAAGFAGRLDPRLLLAARVIAAAAALPLAFQLAPVAPGRSAALVAVGLPLAAGALPDLLIERLARRRRRAIAAALPDSLELMAVGAGAGGGARSLLDSGAAGCRPGPLREELLRAAAAIECGSGSGAALAELRARGGGDVAGLAQLLERSRRLGSPLAAGLQEQARSLRERQAREIEERAARAAPKIQLIVALLLVPSVLLLVAAAILANAETLLSGL